MEVGHGLEFLPRPAGKFTVLVFNPVSIPLCKMDGPHDREGARGWTSLLRAQME